LARASRRHSSAPALQWRLPLEANDRLQQTATELGKGGGRLLAVPADVTDEDAVRALVERCVTEFGRLDLAINNATDGPMPAPLADIPSDGFALGVALGIRTQHQ
jgi:NAD(P)-dependent dehydrogenase (short-subunit alcohol dehydrogenase family)